MNHRIEKIIDNSQAVIFYWQAKENWPVDYVSKNIEMFGYTEEDFLSGQVRYASIIYPDDLERVAEEVACYTEEGINQFRQVYRVLDAQGQIRWIDDRTVIERDSEGNPTYYLGTIIDITEQKEVESLSIFLGQVVEQSSGGIYIFENESWQLTYLNQAALAYTGFSMDEGLQKTIKDIRLDIPVEDLQQQLSSLENQLESKVVFEAFQIRKDATRHPVELRVQQLEWDGKLQYIAVIRDISERKLLEKTKENQHQFVQNILDALPDDVLVIRTDYSIEWMNKSAQEKADLAIISDVNSPKCYEVSHHRNTPCDGLEHPCPLKDVQASGEPMTVIHNHGHDGEDNFVELVAKPLRNERDEIYAIVESAHDITKMVKTQEVLKEQADMMSYHALHDNLTALPNRRLFADLCDQALQRAKRLVAMVSVAFIDIDKFKEINDSLGHQAGDEVLVEVANRLKNCLRVTDTVSRLGGDEFTLILEGLHKRQEIEQILTKVLQAFKVPIKTSAGEVVVTLSVGISVYPQDGSERKTLVRHADKALYDVKMNGRDGFRFYDELDYFDEKH